MMLRNMEDETALDLADGNDDVSCQEVLCVRVDFFFSFFFFAFGELCYLTTLCKIWLDFFIWAKPELAVHKYINKLF